MTIVELLAEVGADNIKYQKLDECLIRAHSAKRGVDITFGTSETGVAELMAGDGPFGFILWIDRTTVRCVQAKMKRARPRRRRNRSHDRRTSAAHH
jgi:hypothetical protein